VEQVDFGTDNQVVTNSVFFSYWLRQLLFYFFILILCVVQKVQAMHGLGSDYPYYNSSISAGMITKALLTSAGK